MSLLALQPQGDYKSMQMEDKKMLTYSLVRLVAYITLLALSVGGVLSLTALETIGSFTDVMLK